MAVRTTDEGQKNQKKVLTRAGIVRGAWLEKPESSAVPLRIFQGS
jgi:hypothetical protein